MSNVFKALIASRLLDRRGRISNLFGFREQQLRDNLRAYVHERLSSPDLTEHGLKSQATFRSPSSTEYRLQSIVSNAFFYDVVYIKDPIEPHVHRDSKLRDAMSSVIGASQDSKIDRRSLGKSIQSLLNLKPLIDIGAVRIVQPNDIVDVEDIPIYFREDQFRSQIPNSIHDFIHNSAIVSNAVPSEGGIALPFAPAEKPSRAIGIRFANDIGIENMGLYFLRNSRFEERNGEKVMVYSSDVDSPITEEEFSAWCYQSINQTIVSRLREMQRLLHVSDQLNATYQTESSFEAELCSLAYNAGTANSKATKAVNFLNANAENIRVSNPSLLAELRNEKNAALFREWQANLQGVLRDLDTTEDFQSASQELYYQQIAPVIRAFEKKAETIKSRFVTTSASLSLGIMTYAFYNRAEIPLIALLSTSVAAIHNAIPEVVDYLKERRGPAYVWSRLKRNG